MAAVSKKSPVTKKAAVTKKATVVKAKPKGIQLSAAQWKAYNKSYTSSMSAQALTSASNRFRKYRLKAAIATQASYARLNRSVQAAAVAAYATRRSYIQSVDGHQNAALRSRIEIDMYNHQNALGRLQYAQGGEKKYVARAVARTVDDAQARAHEETVIAAAARIRKAALKSVSAKKKPVYKKSKNSKVNAIANAAGMKAAAAVKGSGQGGSAKAGSAKAGSAKAPTAKAKAATQKASATAKASAHATASKSAKAAVAKPKGRTAAAGKPGYKNDGFLKYDTYNTWLGKPDTPICVPVAIANHMLYTTGLRMTEAFLGRFAFHCGHNPTIEQALQALKSLTRNNVDSFMFWYSPVKDAAKYELCEYAKVPARYAHSQGLVVGYESEYGPHAALSLGNGTVVSWGQEIPNDADIEEAWMIDWAASGRL